MTGNRLINRISFGVLFLLTLSVGATAQSISRFPDPAPECTTTRAPANGLVDLMVVTRAEQRAEGLRSKLFDLDLRELELKNRIEYLDYRMSPDGIYQALCFVGSARPMDELRDALRLKLESEKERVTRQAELLAATRENLHAALFEAEMALKQICQRVNE